MSIGNRRLQKELMGMKSEGTPVGIELISADNFETWYLTVEVLGDTVYEGEKFALKFRFDGQYPISAPAVQFVVDGTYRAPIHPHVYSNGHICASILGSEWSPVLSVVSVCVTIQSMLASCKVRPATRLADSLAFIRSLTCVLHSFSGGEQKKVPPPDNDRYVAHAPENPKKTRWDFHDDDV